MVHTCISTPQHLGSHERSSVPASENMSWIALLHFGCWSWDKEQYWWSDEGYTLDLQMGWDVYRGWGWSFWTVIVNLALKTVRKYFTYFYFLTFWLLTYNHWESDAPEIKTWSHESLCIIGDGLWMYFCYLSVYIMSFSCHSSFHILTHLASLFRIGLLEG
jgi:hypothetical protein